MNAAGERPDKILFTPGPLLTSYSVKAAALRDLGSRDIEFIGVVKKVCARLPCVPRVTSHVSRTRAAGPQ